VCFSHYFFLIKIFLIYYFRGLLDKALEIKSLALLTLPLECAPEFATTDPALATDEGLLFFRLPKLSLIRLIFDIFNPFQ
jgi:hypothetical protein